MLYLPLECYDPEEAQDAIESLKLLGVSITAPLKELLPKKLGLPSPINTLWRQNPEKPWQGTSTDYTALDTVLNSLTRWSSIDSRRRRRSKGNAAGNLASKDGHT